jgi:hypothetical protein
MEKDKTIVLPNGKTINTESHILVDKVVWQVEYDNNIAGISYHKLHLYYYKNIRCEILSIKKGGSSFGNSIESIWLNTDVFYKAPYYDLTTCKFKQKLIRDFIIFLLKQNNLHLLQSKGVQSTTLKELYLL